MKTPSEYFNKPVIGKIVTEELTYGDVTFSSTEYEVIDIIDDEIYVCNQWYDDHKKKPQLVHKNMVRTFTKI